MTCEISRNNTSGNSNFIWKYICKH